MTSYFLIQRSRLEPPHRQGYIALTWGIMDSLGTMAGYVFIEVQYVVSSRCHRDATVLTSRTRSAR